MAGTTSEPAAREEKQSEQPEEQEKLPPGVAKLRVKVPENGEPGQIVYFMSPTGQQLQTKVPEDKKPGDEFTVLIQMPASTGPTQARVKVPEGVKPGEKIVFLGPHGYNLEALVPEGKAPGDEFHVALPPPPQTGPSTFWLTVPDDKNAGDELFFDANGQHMRAIIPEGKEPGDTFEVHVGPSQLLVTVPEGKQPGEEIEFQGPGGKMKAVVPKGIKAGERFSVSLVNDPALHSGLPALCTACSHGDLEEAKKLVAASNLSVNGTFDQGFTPLFYAATSGAFEVAKWLVQERADVNASNESKRTPLHWASRNGHVKVVELLLAARAEMNGPDGTGRNPLALAIGYKQEEVVEVLKNAGAEDSTAK